MNTKRMAIRAPEMFAATMTAPDLEESRSIAQFTLFTDDVPRAKPLIIFKEKSFETCDY